MKQEAVVGIIAEYNPFHNGHAYQIARAKELTGARYAVIVMSGNFVQRGAPALIDKHTRTRMALSGGADLVLELPVCCATAGADRFAEGAVSILDRLGVVTHLCFGSESGDLAPLQQTAHLLASESSAFSERLQAALKTGIPYAKAMETAVLAESGISLPEGFLSQPNHLLGISYLKALKRQQSSIQGITVKRLGQAYNDTAFPPSGHADASGFYASAAAIRNAVLTDDPSWRQAIPVPALDIFSGALERTGCLTSDDFSQALGYALLQAAPADYLDLSLDLANRIRKLLPAYRSFSQFAALLKNKSNTYTAVCRGLLHILLDIRQSDPELFLPAGSAAVPTMAVRILGFRKDAAPLLSEIKKNSTLSLISRLAEYEKDPVSNANTDRIFRQTLRADALYRLVQMQKSSASIPTEYEQPIIILNS